MSRTLSIQNSHSDSKVWPGAWAPHVLAIELKKALSYRLDFWVIFFVTTSLELCVAYFLWRAVYESQGATAMAGYSFHAIMFYYLFANFSIRIARGSERGYVSQEIYDGGLTRYLLYPVSFLAYKYVTHFAVQLLTIFQLVIAMVGLMLLMDLPPDQNITFASFTLGLLTCLITGAMHFAMALCLEFVAFWQDVIWNLMVMLRFIVGLLGGGLIPIAFFPEWGQTVVMMTPFPLLISFPVRVFFGQVTVAEWFRSIGLISIWMLVFGLIAFWVWKRGIREYSGVGI